MPLGQSYCYKELMSNPDNGSYITSNYSALTMGQSSEILPSSTLSGI